MMKAIKARVAMLLTAITITAQAQPVYVDIAPCMNLRNAETRLACYDGLGQHGPLPDVEQVMTGVTIPREVGQDRESEQESEQKNEQKRAIVTDSRDEEGQGDAVADFGRGEKARVRANAEGVEELVDTIVELDQKVPNQWVITLASGQVWAQINSSRFRLREGEQVRIYPSPFGSSYRLGTVNANGFIQVRRIE